MTIQLNPPIPLETPLGRGIARFLHSEPDFNDRWIVFLDSGVIWTFDNSDVRAVENLTEGRLAHKPTQCDPVEFMREYTG